MARSAHLRQFSPAHRIVEPSGRCNLLAAADRRREKDVIVPDDWRAPAESGNGCPPDDVVGLAPGVGQGRIVGGDAGQRAAELRPLIGRGQEARRRPASTRSSPATASTQFASSHPFAISMTSKMRRL